jgi:hypothetical protein
MSHPDDSTIERYVMGALDDDAAFVAHVGGCPECSRKVQREAEIELAMIDVRSRAAKLAPVRAAALVAEAHVPGGSSPAALRDPRRGGRFDLARRAIGPALVLAAAAAFLLWVGQQRIRAQRASSEGAAVRVVTCPDGPEQLRCVAEANRSGAQLEYPKGTPLAALGSEPGLTVYVAPKSSEGPVPQAEEFLAKATIDLKTCGEKAIVVQEAPMQTGEVGLNFSIAADGRVRASETSLVLHTGRPVEDLDAPMVPTDLALARCLRTTAHAFPFKGTGQSMRLSISAKYVWRE